MNKNKGCSKFSWKTFVVVESPLADGIFFEMVEETIHRAGSTLAALAHRRRL